MLPIYMRRMRNNNLKIRVAGSSCHPQWHFWQKGYPFWIPFEDPCFPLYNLIAVSAMSFKYEQITKPDPFPDFITDILLQCMCWPFWAFLLTEMTDFPILSYTSTSEISCLSLYQKPEKSPPELHRIGHHRKYPWTRVRFQLVAIFMRVCDLLYYPWVKGRSSLLRVLTVSIPLSILLSIFDRDPLP